MSRKSLYNIRAGVPLVALLGLIGCSRAVPTQMEGVLASNASADDHMAAAMLYQSKVRQLAAEAVRYEAEASKIGPYEDTKGFRRGGLMTVAQERRNEAARMQVLYAGHLEKAQIMYGLKKSE